MKRITFGSICSGIEAASVAWLPLGLKALWLSEIESYPCRVLAQRFPETPNLGDITALDFATRAAQCGKPDIIVGGTPCQAFSVAGLRRGLADERGNLTLRYVEICNAIGPTVCVWENVPGVLSSTDNAFGCFLGALVGADWPLEPGPRPAVGKSSRLWRWHRAGRRHLPRWPGAGFCVGPERRAAWRILDAQHFGVPQQRRRVFVVACAGGSGIDPAEILFEREGVRGNPAPGGQAGTPIARAVTASTGGASGKEQQLTFVGADGAPLNPLETAHALPASHDGSEDGTGRGIPLIASAVTAKWAKGSGGPSGDECQNLFLRQEIGVRRLTPRECERLQGFPDDFTLVDWPTARRPKDIEEMTAYFIASGWPEDLARELAKTPDGHRYKALGNSMATPVMQWLGARVIAAMVKCGGIVE